MFWNSGGGSLEDLTGFRLDSSSAMRDLDGLSAAAWVTYDGLSLVPATALFPGDDDPFVWTPSGGEL